MVGLERNSATTLDRIVAHKTESSSSIECFVKHISDVKPLRDHPIYLLSRSAPDILDLSSADEYFGHALCYLLPPAHHEMPPYDCP